MTHMFMSSNQNGPSIFNFIQSNLLDSFISYFAGVAIDSIREGAQSIKWKRDFVNIGKDSFQDFEEISSKLNKTFFKKLSKEIQRKSGFDLKNKIQTELFKELKKQGMSSDEIDKRIDIFVLNIISYLKEKDTEKYLEVYLSEWRATTEKELDRLNKILVISTGINEIYSIQQENERLKENSKDIEIGLDFYELDDEKFIDEFDSRIQDETIFIKGNSKEETILRVLSYLNKSHPEKECYVVRSKNAWNKIRLDNQTNSILIPDFYTEEIVPIPNNTNIFVYSIYEFCPGKEIINLRKRTISNITKALERQGMESENAYKLVTRTHGQFTSMKRILYKTAEHKSISWKKRDKNIITALLCSSWFEFDKDKSVIEHLSGINYSKFKEDLSEYIFSENCYLIEFENYGTCTVQLACPEEAWEELDIYINQTDLIDLLNLLKEILNEVISEQKEQTIIDSEYKKNHYSKKLINGMLNTLIMYTCYKGHNEFQPFCDNFVNEILDSISTIQHWQNISDYFCKLCEISPETCLSRMEKEIKDNGTLIDVFKIQSNNPLFGKHEYVDYLFGLQMLMNDSTYVKRVIDLLWKLEALNIKYTLGNTPKDVLKFTFCAWYPSIPLDCSKKIEMAKDAINHFPNAWNIILSEINFNSLSTSDFKFQYRENSFIENPTNKDVIQIYNSYFDCCLDTANDSVDRWKKLVTLCYKFGNSKEIEVLKKIEEILQKWNDNQKYEMYFCLRDFIYRERYFGKKKLSKDRILNYENVLNNILFVKKEYYYLYLFSPKYTFPLLHPIPYQLDGRDENIKKYREELKLKFSEFKQKSLNLETLIKLRPYKVQSEEVGSLIAQFYTDVFDKEVFLSLKNSDDSGAYCLQYIEYYQLNDLFVLEDLIQMKVNKEIDDITFRKCLLTFPLDDELLNYLKNMPIDEKKFYWKHVKQPSVLVDNEKYVEIFNECAINGNLNTYLYLLFRLQKKINKDELLNYFLIINKVEIENLNSEISLLFTDLDKKLYSYFKDYQNVVDKLAEIEIKLIGIINFDNYGEMYFLNESIRNSPILLVEILKSFTADKNKNYFWHTILQECVACPAEKNGVVIYESLVKWINEYLQLLKDNKLEGHWVYPLGKLLCNGPIGKDGIQPCEAIRSYFENNWNDQLALEFMTAEFNKRGAYDCSAGEESYEISKRYFTNSENLETKGFSRTATIYKKLAMWYELDAKSERKASEYEN